MPLQLQAGEALNPVAPDVPTKEVNFADPKIPDNAPPEPVILKVEHVFQEGLLWCWAACIQMVLKYYDKPTHPDNQCKIVKIKLGDETHQCPNEFDLKDDDCRPRLMAQAWRDCGITEVVPVNESVSLEVIKEELKAHRPLEVGISWTNGGGHAVLIKGWAATSPESVVIDDPLRQSPLNLPSSGRATYQELRSALGHGTWDYTWINLE